MLGEYGRAQKRLSGRREGRPRFGEGVTTEQKTAKIELTEGNARYALLALRELNDKMKALALDEEVMKTSALFHATI